MLRIDRSKGTLVRLSQTSLSSAGITERNDLQALILKNAVEFFEKECNENLFVLGEEVPPSGLVADRIDLLAIDDEGQSVIIELKRGEHKLQLLQALTYASMIAGLEEKEFQDLVPANRRDSFEEFVNENSIEAINERQRILLIAEHYDYVILSTAQWLTDFYGMNITCYQVSLAQDAANGSEYLSAMQLFPPKELAAQAQRRGAIRSEEGTKFPDMGKLLESCENAAVKAYFEAFPPDVRTNKRNDSIVFPQVGKTRFRVRPERESARVTQLDQFDGDQSLWNRSLSSPSLSIHGPNLPVCALCKLLLPTTVTTLRAMIELRGAFDGRIEQM
jgi:hypothetical protein